MKIKSMKRADSFQFLSNNLLFIYYASSCYQYQYILHSFHVWYELPWLYKKKWRTMTQSSPRWLATSAPLFLRKYNIDMSKTRASIRGPWIEPPPGAAGLNVRKLLPMTSVHDLCFLYDGLSKNLDNPLRWLLFVGRWREDPNYLDII